MFFFFRKTVAIEKRCWTRDEPKERLRRRLHDRTLLSNGGYLGFMWRAPPGESTLPERGGGGSRNDRKVKVYIIVLLFFPTSPADRRLSDHYVSQ